jgi:uroporphyrinogen-III synthase
VPSLAHKRILVTRTRHQASELAAQLEALGAIPVLIPTIEIIPPETYAPLDAALAQLDTFDWLLFTSVNAVEVFHQRRNLQSTEAPPAPTSNTPTPNTLTPNTPTPGAPCPDSRTWASTQPKIPPSKPNPKIAVIGPATARAVESIGLAVDLVPPQYIAESLSAALIPHAPNSRMLLIRATEARDHLPESLTAAGAHLTIAPAYRNQIPPDSIPALQSLFSHPAHYPDAITFTSASTARNLFTLLETANLTLPSGITLASIGPITSQTLLDLGHQPTVEATEPTIPALIQALTTHFRQPA